MKFLHNFQCGHTTECEYIKSNNNKTQRFTVVYAHGFCSDPWGTKPNTVKQWCIDNNIDFFRFEIAGHGSDVDNFEKTTINTYKNQFCDVLDNIVEGNVLLVGASLGGWLSLLAATKYPNRVIGFIGLAAAPDFLKTYIENYFRSEHKDMLDKYGKIEFPTNDFVYTITKDMMESADENLLLNKNTIPYSGKVILLQGMEDAALNWKTALKIAEKLESDDVSIKLLKKSNHRLNSDSDVLSLLQSLDMFL